jgi:hypothetical protein
MSYNSTSAEPRVLFEFVAPVGRSRRCQQHDQIRHRLLKTRHGANLAHSDRAAASSRCEQVSNILSDSSSISDMASDVGDPVTLVLPGSLSAFGGGRKDLEITLAIHGRSHLALIAGPPNAAPRRFPRSAHSPAGLVLGSAPATNKSSATTMARGPVTEHSEVRRRPIFPRHGGRLVACCTPMP